MLFWAILFYFCVFCVFIGHRKKGSISRSIGLKGQFGKKLKVLDQAQAFKVVRSSTLHLGSSTQAKDRAQEALAHTRLRPKRTTQRSSAPMRQRIVWQLTVIWKEL